jgi:hypothetical protein
MGYQFGDVLGCSSFRIALRATVTEHRHVAVFAFAISFLNCIHIVKPPLSWDAEVVGVPYPVLEGQ